MLNSGILLDYLDFPKLLWNIDIAFVTVTFIYFGMWFKRTDMFEKKWLIPALAILGLTTIYANHVDGINFDNEYGNFILIFSGASCISVS